MIPGCRVSFWRDENILELDSDELHNSVNPLKSHWIVYFKTVVPSLFDIRDWFHGRQFSHGPGQVGDGFRMIQVHYIYCALYFYSNAAADLIWQEVQVCSLKVGDPCFKRLDFISCELHLTGLSNVNISPYLFLPLTSECSIPAFFPCTTIQPFIGPLFSWPSLWPHSLPALQ